MLKSEPLLRHLKIFGMLAGASLLMILVFAPVIRYAIMSETEEPLRVATACIGRDVKCVTSRLGAPNPRVTAEDVRSGRQEFPYSTFERPRTPLEHEVLVYFMPWCMICVFVDPDGKVTAVERLFS